ncbi:hypothetical protein A9Q68_04670 [Streptococcus bovimastitidis]|uniref:Beta-carotene 15,15'-monooxygenase n=1 Tax=Streptococcus bovimastitidis TaxID=1856638 RepID=A0A1L8MQJ4_9STRE|nr:hypothetical protein A9Q68_04670 [Streptococcus bovimastitidis]
MAALLAVLGFFMFTKMASSTYVNQMNQDIVSTLDQKKVTVMKLAASSTAASTAVTLIPGDVGSPLAENLADVSDYLLVIIIAIWLQKYLIAIAGAISFKIFFPATCLLLILYLFSKKEILIRVAFKLALFGLMIFCIVPTSVSISNHIEKTYQSSIQETIKKTEKENKRIDQKLQKKNQKLSLKNILGKIDGEKSKVLNTMENSLSNMIDAVAVMIVTTCLIPILVLMSFIWLTNLIFGLSLTTDLRRFSFIGKFVRNKTQKSLGRE